MPGILTARSAAPQSPRAPLRRGTRYKGPVPRRSAGILLYRDGPEVLLVHPGGPFWAAKDAGAWSIPKGEHEDGEDARAAALREFAEETGSAPAPGELVDLGT